METIPWQSKTTSLKTSNREMFLKIAMRKGQIRIRDKDKHKSKLLVRVSTS
jgi:hypothetical protein